MKKEPTAYERRAGMIGRPGIGGEFLAVHESGYGRFQILRYRRLNSCTDSPRQLHVDDLPAEAMVYDLLTVIENITKYMSQTTDQGLDIDHHGIAGDSSSLRERFAKLAE